MGLSRARVPEGFSKQTPEPPKGKSTAEEEQDRRAARETGRDLARLLLHRDLGAELLVDGAERVGVRRGEGLASGT